MKFSLNYMILNIFLVVICILFYFLIDWQEQVYQSQAGDLEKKKKDIRIAMELANESPKDSYTNLLKKLKDYCSEVGIGNLECNVQSSQSEVRNDYETSRYTVTLQPVLMDKTVKFFSKLEELPENVRVIRSSIQAFKEVKNKNVHKPAHLVVRVEMNEIKFKKQDL